MRAGLIDRTVIRDRYGYLYIPGSTIKGVLRERCEQLARLYEGLDEDMRELIADPHEEKIALRGLGQKITMITRIFGSQIHPGHLFFDDARQADEDKQQYNSDRTNDGRYQSLQVDLYTQARIDRPTRTAVQGALYTSEFGVRGLTFKGCIVGWLECTAINSASDDSPTYSLLLLLSGLTMIEWLGGNKSTGKGQCRSEITGLKINQNICPPERWQSWLEHLEALSFYSTL